MLNRLDGFGTLAPITVQFEGSIALETVTDESVLVVNVEPGHPRAVSRPITVAQAIGHLPRGVQGAHGRQIIAAWHRSRPKQSLRKAARYVGSFQSVRLDPSAPSPTQCKAHLNWHYAVPRKLTIEEAAILGSFPPGFRWPGTKGDARNQIGNSVPPLMMRAIAKHIRAAILERIAEEATA